MYRGTSLLLLSLVVQVSSHGRVLEPASRASAWRRGFDTPRDYDDDGANCGGLAHQWVNNKGRCGICGDPYDLAPPRPHELGGQFGDGVIVAHYEAGAIIPTEVELTTSHKGFWEFKLCPNPQQNNQKCFDKYPLRVARGGRVYRPEKGSGVYKVQYQLPKGLVCEHCVLQWRYTAGNNWGDCANGTQGTGCGNQEQFGACSDISIGVSQFNEVDTRYERPKIKPKPLSSSIDHEYSLLEKEIYAFLKRGKTKKKTTFRKKHKRQRHNSKKPRKRLTKKFKVLPQGKRKYKKSRMLKQLSKKLRKQFPNYIMWRR